MLPSFVFNAVPRAPLRHPLSTYLRCSIAACTKSGASIAVFESATAPTRVLLVRRGNAPNKGLWSLPGGRVKQGESLRDAAVRELHEETSVAPADVIVSKEYLETLSFPPYTVHVFAGLLTRPAVPERGDDAQEAQFFEVDQIDKLDHTDGLDIVIDRVLRRLPELQLD